MRGEVYRGHEEQIHFFPVLSLIDTGVRCLTVEH